MNLHREGVGENKHHGWRNLKRARRKTFNEDFPKAASCSMLFIHFGPQTLKKLPKRGTAFICFISLEIRRKAQCFAKVDGWVGMERSQVRQTRAITTRSITGVLGYLSLSVLDDTSYSAIISDDGLRGRGNIKKKCMCYNRGQFLPNVSVFQH